MNDIANKLRDILSLQTNPTVCYVPQKDESPLVGIHGMYAYTDRQVAEKELDRMLIENGEQKTEDIKIHTYDWDAVISTFKDKLTMIWVNPDISDPPVSLILIGSYVKLHIW